MDNAFSKQYNEQAKNYSGDKNSFVTQMNTARNNTVYNAYGRIKDQPQEYKNFYYEYEKAKFIYDNANKIYQGSDDPRESANAHYLAQIINKLYPSISVDVAEKSYRPLMKSVTGDDMSATNIMQVWGKTFSNNFNSLLLGGRIYMHAMTDKVFQPDAPEEVQKKKDEQYKERIDEIKASKGLIQRTDYYNKDFDSFIEQSVLATATILPSMVFSLGPEVLGATVAAFTKMPIFYQIGHGVSAASASFMEAGGMALDLYEAGADWDTIRSFSSVVGLANGALEIVGNIPEARINNALFGMKALKKSLGTNTGKELTGGLASTVFKKMAVNYSLGLIAEPTTEALQELVSMYGMNMAIKWEEKNKGKSFDEEFGFSKEEMIEAMNEVALSTFKGQLLLGMVGEGIDLYTNLRKGGQFMYSENRGTGFKWDTGDLRKIYDARKYGSFNPQSLFVDSKSIVTDKKTKAFTPAEINDKGIPTEKVQATKVRSIGGEFMPINAEEMAKAKYLQNSSEGMYIDVVDNEDTSKYINRTSEESKSVVNGLIDENDGHRVNYSIKKDGSIVVEKSDIDAVVRDYVASNISNVEAVQRTDDGYVVSVNNKNTVFTTKDSKSSEAFSQDEHVHNLMRKVAEGKDEREAQRAKEEIDREINLANRYNEETGRSNVSRANAYNNAINKTINKQFSTKEERTAERAKYKAEEQRLSDVVGTVVDEALKDNKTKGLFATARRDRIVKAFTRASVLVEGKLAQAMGKSISDFAGKVNFVFNPEEIQEGKARMGWTLAKADGTYDINLTRLADQSTAIHELGHAFLYMLGQDGYKSIAGFEQAFADVLKKDNGVIGDNTHEAFAEALEQYVNQGVAADTGLRAVFNSILEALKNFVDAVRDVISPEKIKMFDTLFEKGLKEGWVESDDINEGAQYKTAETDEAQRQYDDVVEKYKGTDQWMKAPNGKPTNLTEEQWVTVRTPNFKAWFGDWENDPENASKVVDENGEPLIVYHGTEAEFNVFNTQRQGGAHFGSTIYQALDRLGLFHDKNLNRDEALSLYGNDNRIGAYFLNIRNPKEYEGDIGDWSGAREYGYDGIIYDNKYEGLYDDEIKEGESNNAFIAFYPNQIKSIDNNGNFSTEDNRIRYKTAEDAKADADLQAMIEQLALDGTYYNGDDQDFLLGTMNVWQNYSFDRKKELVDMLYKFYNDPKHYDKNVGFLAPSGKKSELSPVQYVQVRTDSFKNWAEGDWEKGEGKAILDYNGEPRLFTHMTDADFEEFSIEKSYEGRLGYGFYFTDGKYGYSEAKNELRVFLKANKVVDVGSDNTYGDNETDLYSRYGMLVFPPHSADYYTKETYWSDSENRYKLVYDGYKNDNGYITAKGTDALVGDDGIWVVYNSSQIKSALDNNGDFSTEDNRIRYKTASSYYIDYKLSSGERTEIGNAQDRIITDGFIDVINNTYGDAVSVRYSDDGKLDITFHSQDAINDFEDFISQKESWQLIRPVDTFLDTKKYAMYLPHGNVQLIEITNAEDTKEIFESISDNVKGMRDEAFKQEAETSASLVDLYDMFADDETRNWTRVIHASPNKFAEFMVKKGKNGEVLGKKYGYGVYFFDNIEAAYATLEQIAYDKGDVGNLYFARVRTGDESKYIHITYNNTTDNYLTDAQVSMLKKYVLDKYHVSLEELARQFIEIDMDDYINYNGTTGQDLFRMFDEDEFVDDANDVIGMVSDACSDIVNGRTPSGTSFYYMVQALFGAGDDLKWSASRVLQNAGFDGMIVFNDYWQSDTGVWGESQDPETGAIVKPTELVVFNPEKIEDIERKEVTRQESSAINRRIYEADDAETYAEQRKYKTVWDENEIKETLENGGFVPTNILNQHKNEDAVKIERIAQNIIALHEDVYKASQDAIEEYLEQNGQMMGELDDNALDKILDIWQRKLKDSGSDFNIMKTENMALLLKRLNAYATDESPERTTAQWLGKYTNVREGRSNIQELAVQMEKAGLFNDKIDVDGEKYSEKYPALNFIADKVASSKERNNKRIYIDSAAYQNALDEIMKNSSEIMSDLEIDAEFAKGDINAEIDSNEDYVESRSVKALLELELEEEVKDAIQEGRWDNTVVKNLAKKYSKVVRERNLQNKTIQELRNKRDQLKKEVSSNKNLQEQINDLTEDIMALTSMYAAKKLEAELYKTKKQITEIVNAKSGDAQLKRIIKEAVRSVMSTTQRAVNEGLEVMIDPISLDKIPYIKAFLESNDFIIDGNLVAGIDDMTIAQMNQFKKAIRHDKKVSRDVEEKRKAEFVNKVGEDARKVIGTMSNSKLSKLTKDEAQQVKDIADTLIAGRTDLTKKELAEINEKAMAQVLEAKIENIMRDARYGTEEHKKANRKKGTLGDDFTTFSRLLRNVSPQLYKIVMEDGLNVVTDNKYKMFDERYSRFLENMEKITGIKEEKKMRKYLKNLLSESSTLGVITNVNDMSQRLLNSEFFQQILEEDAPDKEKTSATKYTLQEMMAIYEHSFDEGSMKHIHDGNKISAYEIAWVVDQFENGAYKGYKEVADEIRRVMGERVDKIYDTVLKNENREIHKVSFYSAQINIDYDADLGMSFSYSFGDDKVSQKKSFTKDRQFGSNAISLQYYSDLRKIIEMQEAYINGASFFREMDSLFSSKGGNLRNVISEMYGPATSDRIMQMLDICKNDAVVGNRMTEADGWVSKVRNHYVLARLAYNLSSVFQQVASYFLGFSKYGVGTMWNATMQFMMHPIQMCNKVYELSPQMRHAVNPLLAMAEDTMAKNPDSVAGKINNALSSVGSKGLVLMEKLDHLVRNTLWWASYQSELDAMSENGKQLSAEDTDLAQRRATQWVMDIQSSSQAKDNSLIYARGDALWKNLLMFTNQMNKEWNMLWNDAIKDGLLKGEIGKFFANFAALSLATMWVVFSTGKIKNDEDDDETWIEDLLQDFSTEFVSRVPVLGQTAKNALEGFTYEQTDDPITRTIELVKKLSSGDKKKTKTAIKNEVWSVLDIFGAPTTAIKRGYRSFEGGDFLQADHFLRQLGGEWYKYFE